MNNTLDPWIGFVVVTLIVAAVMAIQLWRGRKLEAKRNREFLAEWQAKAHAGEQDATGEDAEDWQQASRRAAWNAAIRQINSLLVECNRLKNGPDFHTLQNVAGHALSIALERLSADHWMSGLCLDWLGYAEMCQGRHYDALRHLEAARAILSEWTQQDAHCRQSLLPRIAACRQSLGFNQDGD